MGNSVRVLVVDDSAIVREVLTRELTRYSGIEVVGTAPDPYIARDKILQLMPDVMTLDVEMPRMDGLTFLRKVMQHRPIPTIVVSSLTPQGSAMAMEALDAGAVDVLCKPGSSYTVGDLAPVLAQMVVAAARVDMRKLQEGLSRPVPETPAPVTRRYTERILAIGASTGGTRAIEAVLRAMPSDAPGILVVQHMPMQFTKAFAGRLDQCCDIQVREAQEGDRVLAGTALIAPGNYHMRVQRVGNGYEVRLDQEERLHFQRPAVDSLFFSLAKEAGENVVAALLTGMGRDGADGLLALREAGAYTLAQDKDSCVVYGMPGEAVRIGAAVEVLPLVSIAETALYRLFA